MNFFHPTPAQLIQAAQAGQSIQLPAPSHLVQQQLAALGSLPQGASSSNLVHANMSQLPPLYGLLLACDQSPLLNPPHTSPMKSGNRIVNGRPITKPEAFMISCMPHILPPVAQNLTKGTVFFNLAKVPFLNDTISATENDPFISPLTLLADAACSTARMQSILHTHVVQFIEKYKDSTEVKTINALIQLLESKPNPANPQDIKNRLIIEFVNFCEALKSDEDFKNFLIHITFHIQSDNQEKKHNPAWCQKYNLDPRGLVNNFEGVYLSNIVELITYLNKHYPSTGNHFNSAHTSADIKYAKNIYALVKVTKDIISPSAAVAPVVPHRKRKFAPA